MYLQYIAQAIACVMFIAIGTRTFGVEHIIIRPKETKGSATSLNSPTKVGPQ